MDWEGIRLKGALIRRGNDRMLELLPGSLQAFSAPQAVTLPAILGPVKLIGEIVDSKCYLGVMNPGNGNVHRDCAARCISGGIPPAFIVTDASGETRTMLLVGANGRRMNQEVLDFVAEPLEITGRLLRMGSTLVLEAEPKDFRRE